MEGGRRRREEVGGREGQRKEERGSYHFSNYIIGMQVI